MNGHAKQRDRVLLKNYRLGRVVEVLEEKVLENKRELHEELHEGHREEDQEEDLEEHQEDKLIKIPFHLNKNECPNCRDLWYLNLLLLLDNVID